MISSRLQMRRFENGTHDPAMIAAILDEVNIVHVGCFDEEYPYVVPLSFGYEIKDDKLIVYLHGAREGHKVDLWKKNPHVALTFSMFYNHPDRLYKDCMHDFRSVMALGTISTVDMKKQSRLTGRAVQTMLRQNNRRPNQFSVPHYMWMGLYVVTCDMADVVGKFENPIEDPCEVPFPDVYSIPENNEPYDVEYFYHKKSYQAKQNSFLPACMEVPGTDGEGTEASLDGKLGIKACWTLKPGHESEDIDIDLNALVLDSDGKVPRRYDMVFYNQPADRSGSVVHCGDDIAASSRGSESLMIYPEKLPDYLSQIVVSLSRYGGADQPGSGLDVLSGVTLTIMDESGAALAGFSFGAEELSGGSAALISLKRLENTWEIRKAFSSMPSWKILDQSRCYGLAKWKE